MKNKKIIASMLTFLLTFSFIGTTSSQVFASEITNQITNQNETLSDTQIETFGVKKWIATQALKLTSKAVRSGGKIVSQVAGELGGTTGKTFLKHTSTVADALDYLIARGAVVEDAVIDTVSSFLISAGVKSSVARTIANVFTFLAF